MSMEDKIREAVKKCNKDGDCGDCKVLDFCTETIEYTGMIFCIDSAEDIIKELNREG